MKLTVVSKIQVLGDVNAVSTAEYLPTFRRSVVSPHTSGLLEHEDGWRQYASAKRKQPFTSRHGVTCQRLGFSNFLLFHVAGRLFSDLERKIMNYM